MARLAKAALGAERPCSEIRAGAKDAATGCHKAATQCRAEQAELTAATEYRTTRCADSDASAE